MGMDLFDKLGFRVVEEKSGVVSQVGVTETRCSRLFSGLGQVTNFVHIRSLRWEVAPVQQSLRRLPLSIREEVSVELPRMVQEGIIERIGTAPGLSNIVVVRKASGEIRLC